MIKRLSLLPLLLFALQACDASLSEGRGEGWVGAEPASTQAYKSPASKGAGITLVVNAPELIAEELESGLELLFTLSPNDKLSITMLENDAVQISNAGLLSQSKLQADDKGVVAIQFDFIPLQAGKIYLKFFATVEREGREISQVFSVPIYVADDTGMASYKKDYSEQVVLPAARH